MMKTTMHKYHAIIGAIALLQISSLQAQVPFSTSPAWTSTDVSNYSTGAGWGDFNRDGWLDLAVANGNDMARQRVAIYFNNGSGSLPTTPGWQSGDVDYHGHLSIGDINGDGYPDIAVSVYLGAGGFAQRGKAKVYLNNAGTFGSLPSWVSRDSMFTFSCAFGDADNDGDLDLAVAGGESYNHRPERNRIYYNHGGILDSLPGWSSSEAGYSYDVGWGDFDADGDLDLVFANESGPNKMYRNDVDSIGRVAVWSSTDASQQANSLFIGDVDNNGFPDLAISDNDQLGGTGRFKIYLNATGLLSTTPFWTSAFSGYGSGINLADIDHDGDKDLITGGWWQPCRIYMNQAGSFSSAPEWTSATGSVVEAIVCGDYDNDGLDTVASEFISDGVRKLYCLAASPVHRILGVSWNGDPDSVSAWCADLENGWLSFSIPPSPGVRIVVVSLVSHDLDFAVSNWDPTVGNYLFRNTTPVAVAENPLLPSKMRLEQNYPNPFNPTTTIVFTLPSQSTNIAEGRGRVGSYVTLKVYDLLGREVATLVNEQKTPGRYEVEWNTKEAAGGVYLYRLEAWNYIETRKMILLR